MIQFGLACERVSGHRAPPDTTGSGISAFDGYLAQKHDLRVKGDFLSPVLNEPSLRSIICSSISVVRDLLPSLGCSPPCACTGII